MNVIGEKNERRNTYRAEKNAIHHSTTNIIRAIVLLKRADNTLRFANNSLEGTDKILMIQDIGMSRYTIADAIRRLEKYKE